MQINHTAVAEVVQHLPPLEQRRVFRLIERRADRNPRFRSWLDAAKTKAKAEQDERDEWLVRQAEDLDSYHMVDVEW